MITLSNPEESLAVLRDFANTRAHGIYDRGMNAEDFTDDLRENVQKAYDWATDKIRGTVLATLSIEDLSKIHRTLCSGLQTHGGEYNLDAALLYEDSRNRYAEDLEKAVSGEMRITALANHTARCENIQLFPDHNSTVNRIALEVYQDNELGRANRPAVPEWSYLDAVDKAQKGNPEGLSKLIQSNHEKAVSAGKDLWDNQRQNVLGDYTTDRNLENASRDR